MTIKRLIFIGGLILVSNYLQTAQTGDCTMGTQYCEGNSLATTNTTTTTNTNTNNNTNNNTNTNTNTNNNTNTNVSTNTNTNNSSSTSVNTSTSTVSSTATQNVTNNNTNINTNTSNNTNTSTSTSDVSTNNQNVNTNTSTATNTNNNTSNSTQNIQQEINSPPPSAIAPSIMSYSQDLCTTGVSGAFQGQIFGFSGGKSVRDENCERLKLSKYLYDTGMKVAAVSILCQDARVFEAMRNAGTPCPYKGLIGEEAKAAWTSNKKEMPTYQKDLAFFIEQCKGTKHLSGKHKGKRKSERTCKKEFSQS